MCTYTLRLALVIKYRIPLALDTLRWYLTSTKGAAHLLAIAPDTLCNNPTQRRNYGA